MVRPITIYIDPYTELILELGLAFFIAIILYLIHVAVRPGVSRGGPSSEMYIGGEHKSILKRPYAPASALYWGFVRVSAKRIYMYVRYVMHSGVLTTWAEYMAGWFGFLMVVALLSIALAVKPW